MTTLEITNLAELAGMTALAIVCAVIFVLAAVNRKKWLPDIAEIVTLDARGWQFVATMSTVSALLLVLTSQMFGTSYWVGLAADSDGFVWPQVCDAANNCERAGWWRAILSGLSVATVSYFILSVVFEITADLGAPIAAAMKQQKKKGLPGMLLVAVTLAIAMSLISKWGIYEDTKNVRASEGAQMSVMEEDATARLDEATKTIERLNGTPSVEVANATRSSVERQIATLEASIADAKKERDTIPESHSTNRGDAQQRIDRLTLELVAKEEAAIQATTIEENAKQLKQARADREKAREDLKNAAGTTGGDGGGSVRIGDHPIARMIRAGLHQWLCFLFPILSLEARTTARAKKKASDAGKKGAQTKRENANTYDAEYEDVSEEPAFGGYLGGEDDQEAGAEDQSEAGEDPEEDGEGDSHA